MSNETSGLDLHISAAPIPLTSFYAANGTTDLTRRSSTRVIIPNTLLQMQNSKQLKRKREPDPERDAERDRLRKIKKDEQSVATSQLAFARADRDIARKRWLYAHRALFEALLPDNHAFFANLTKELMHNATPPPPMRIFATQPKLVVGGTMKGYQLTGLSFLAHMYHNGISCLLGDDMGLGKTLQTLSLFAHIKETPSELALTHLIVCPLSVLSSWETECARWVPSMRAVRFHGSPAERSRVKEIMRTASGDDTVDIILTTYETLSAADSAGWFKRRWGCVVLDEGHRIKNAETDISARVAALGGMWRVILTGTPIQNNLSEVWGLLRWLYPTIFTPPTGELFAKAFALSKGQYVEKIMTAVTKLLGTVLLRRTKTMLGSSGELTDVPPREEWTVFLPFTEAQRFWTYKLLTRLDAVDLKEIFPDIHSADKRMDKENIKVEQEDDVDDGRREMLQFLENHAKGGSSNQYKKLSMLLMQLRRVCDHPYLIPDVEPNPYYLGQHLVASSSKLIAIDKILADLLPKGERVLIFSQWTGMLDLVEDFMMLRDIEYARLDGSTSRARRALDIRLFQRDDSTQKVYLISTKAGGLGINLTAASACILCDTDWNPQNDLQAIARVHRIGQKKKVKVFRLICRASVEDQMLDRIRRKLFLSAKIIGGEGGGEGGHTGLGGSELLDILRRGSSALERSDDGMDLAHFRSASLAEILQTSRATNEVHDARVKRDLHMAVEAPDAAALLQSAAEEEQRLLSGVAQVRCRLFEGRMVKRQETTEQMVQEWRMLQKRARTDRTVMVDGMAFIADESLTESVGPKTKACEKPEKDKKVPFDWEDYCIECRDGGELVLCQHCPRVFHASCHLTLSEKQVNAANFITCGQHKCWKCSASSDAAGGLLLRCQTCSQAFCSDCVEWDDIKIVGETIPEFVLRNYAKKDAAYYIRCADCCELGRTNPKWLQEWETEIAQSQKLVDMM